MPSVEQFGESFKDFMDTMRSAVPKTRAFFAQRLEEHFGVPAATLPVVTMDVPRYDHPSLQVAVNSVIDEQTAAGTAPEILGIHSEHKRYHRPELSSLAAESSAMGMTPSQGPVEYATIDLADGSTIACVECGLLLLKSESGPLAVLLLGPPEHSMHGNLEVAVMATERSHAETFLADLRRRSHAMSVYRGHVLSIEPRQYGGMNLRFHRLPQIDRESVILPEAVLARIERQTVAVAQHAETLRASGRHLKRGVLLHGPPGTGRTFTAMHLAARMKGRTVILITGRGHGLIQTVCGIARMLQPATVIIEDIDLIAQDRESDSDQCVGPLLFELLNEMDGLSEDSDVLFLLTTNRPKAIEPALSARPGRVDQAIEVPLPDDECRRRLIDLYARGLTLEAVDRADLVRRTRGASAAFIKELLRRAALLSAIDGQGTTVREAQMREALRELLLSGDGLSRKLLGFEEDGTGGNNRGH